MTAFTPMTFDESTLRLRCTVNGKMRSHDVPVRMTLADYLRDVLRLTGTHLGCEQGQCGACTVRANGEVVRACLMLAVQAEGMRIDTIEGLNASGELADLQDAFFRHAALQCGFCTAGMLITADDALRSNPAITRDGVRAALTGQLCRCTGYHAIVDAVVDTASLRRRAGEIDA
ncbi:(2Fe-2S)-binding protein [Pigmentiphaga litoralis]|uniref:(2Fe-2S)-binding protein n=1 Tax=Pigmentiphaga litoralis TaxID=516702 RepID=UPI003B430213